MMNTFYVKILASDKPFYEGDCEFLGIPTSNGELGILAHHSNMIAAILPGTLHFRAPGRAEQIAAISEGIVKVENNEVLILADTIERPEEIDANRAAQAAEAAKEALLQKKSIQEYHSAQLKMARAISRLAVKGREH
jgi:F-type H+-transporting ATPase subunit epsilon